MTGEKRREARTYYGVNIRPMRMNSMGCRWTADVGWSMLQADTLDGIKRLIRNKLGK